MKNIHIPIPVDYPDGKRNACLHKPYLTTYIADDFQAKPRPAIIVCAGGGYAMRSPREGEPIAMRFLAAGCHAFVLHYSVSPARYPCAVLELASAVLYIRDHAAAWSIHPEQIFIIGFSAGGHLCGSLGTMWEDPIFSEAIPGIPPTAWRPDGMILCYPVISFVENAHTGSCENLLGPDASEEWKRSLSLEKRVTASTVPVFLWHTVSDQTVPVENSLLFASSLRKAGVPFEMHLFEHGVHGLSLCDQTTATEDAHIAPDAAAWVSLAVNWLWRRTRKAQ